MITGMRARRVGLLAVAFTLGVAVAAGCGDDGDEWNDVRNTTTTTVEGGESVTPPELEEYVGLSVDDAGALADSEDRPWRIVEEDGEPLPVTRDLVPDRANFVVEDGTVTAATLG
jgi:hypothetical protein